MNTPCHGESGRTELHENEIFGAVLPTLALT